MSFRDLFSHPKPIIGVIHLAPLPGYAASPGLPSVIDQALAALDVYQEGGLDGVLVENENDRPYRVRAAPETIAAMTAVTRALVVAAPRMTVGCEILLNDPIASMSAASSAMAGFIRTDYFVDRMSRPEYGGEMEIDAPGLMRFRHELKADAVLVFADIQVKHAECLETRALDESAVLARDHGADAVIVTGPATGSSPNAADIALTLKGAAGVPVLIGSGLNARNAVKLLHLAGGAIVGTALMKEGRIQAERVSELLDIRESIL